MSRSYPNLTCGSIYLLFSNAICKPAYFPLFKIRLRPNFRSPLCFSQADGFSPFWTSPVFRFRMYLPNVETNIYFAGSVGWWQGPRKFRGQTTSAEYIEPQFFGRCWARAAPILQRRTWGQVTWPNWASIFKTRPVPIWTVKIWQEYFSSIEHPAKIEQKNLET